LNKEFCVYAITRDVSPALTECALTFLDRVVIDIERACAQHEQYECCLRELGLQLISLPAVREMPDSVFVEDTAVVLDETAVKTRPALDTRRAEVESVASVLALHRGLRGITEPGTLEGGDVIRIGRTLYVGLSRRTNAEGARQLAELVRPWGYEVRTVPVEHCLHLKTAATYVGRGMLLANTDWVDVSLFDGVTVVATAEGEDEAGNAMQVNGHLLMPAAFPGTRERLEATGFDVVTVDVSELQKAEAGVTCCSILFA
jgi:dimethylargininase